MKHQRVPRRPHGPAGVEQRHRSRRAAQGRRARAAAWWCFVGAWLTLSAQLLDFGHLLLVSHSVCVAHGELSHVGAHAGTPSWSAQENTPAALPSVGEEADTHDHCVPSNQRRAVLPFADAVEALEPPPAVVSLTLALQSVRVSGRGRFALAPKQSPPALSQVHAAT